MLHKVAVKLIKAGSVTFFILTFILNCKSTESAKKETSQNKPKAIQKIAKSLMNQLNDESRNSIALLPFYDSATKKYYRLSYYINDELLTELYKNKKSGIKIVERSQLEKIMKEAKFHLSGAVSVDTASEIGKLIGVKTLAIGTLSVLKNSVRINARLVNIESGEIIAVENADLSLTPDLKSMLAESSVTEDLKEGSDDFEKGSPGKNHSTDKTGSEKTFPIQQKAGGLTFHVTGVDGDQEKTVFEIKIENNKELPAETQLFTTESHFVDQKGIVKGADYRKTGIAFFDRTERPYNDGGALKGTVYNGIAAKGKIIFYDVNYQRHKPAVFVLKTDKKIMKFRLQNNNKNPEITSYISKKKADDIEYYITGISGDTEKTEFYITIVNHADYPEETEIYTTETHFVDSQGVKKGSDYRQTGLAFFHKTRYIYNDGGALKGTVYNGIPAEGKVIFDNVNYERHKPAVFILKTGRKTLTFTGLHNP